MFTRERLRLLSLTGIAILWVVAVVAVWPLLPTDLARISLLAILLYGYLISLRKSYSLLLLLSVILGMLVINYSIINYGLSIDYGTILAGVLVFIVGLFYGYLTQSWDREFIAKWLFLGLLTSQVFSIFNYWPVSLFNRSLLVIIVFYIVWHYLDVSEESIKTIVAHFAYSIVLAMLVIGSIIWVNFPHLVPF